jgi:hypothetical protein
MAVRFGGMWKAGFGQPKVDPAIADRLKAWTREALALPADSTVSINEILCADPACPGTETVVLVMVPGQRTRAYKVASAMAEVGREALLAALTVPPPASGG